LGMIKFENKKNLTININKYTIDTMMNSTLLHTMFISKPELGQPSYWVAITRDISNCDLGDYRT